MKTHVRAALPDTPRIVAVVRGLKSTHNNGTACRSTRRSRPPERNLLSRMHLSRTKKRTDEHASLAGPLPPDPVGPVPEKRPSLIGMPAAPSPDPPAQVDGMYAAPSDRNPNGTRSARRERVCPYCYSADTMEPFRRSPHVTVISRILPRLRWRYCRSCTRHFLSFAPR